MKGQSWREAEENLYPSTPNLHAASDQTRFQTSKVQDPKTIVLDMG